MRIVAVGALSAVTGWFVGMCMGEIVTKRGAATGTIWGAERCPEDVALLALVEQAARIRQLQGRTGELKDLRAWRAGVDACPN